ncbi:hypothetical protein NPX13_g3194 [Xylaria arbuscula]|uniref:Uncharacterized protein n=1 Tax=Xylaria arbuscula TaxID=114810 RepID=A0A9W8NIN4_9PEZI|nr:hypothetical protein NPX13_g3194 [Xylaria arbuscula]
MPSPPPPSPLLKLPRELRDIIYDFYVAIDGGYVYDFRAGKLRGADAPDRPIDLALTYTCRQITAEMRGVALSANTIHFRTYSAPDVNLIAWQLEQVLEQCSYEANAQLAKRDYNERGISYHYPRFNKSVYEQLSCRFPDCQPLAELVAAMDKGPPTRHGQDLVDMWFWLRQNDCQGGWFEVPSVERDIVHSALKIACDSGHVDFWDVSYRNHLEDFHRSHRMTPYDILDIVSTLMPWAVPTQQEIISAVNKQDKEVSNKVLCTGRLSRGRRYYFSAAAVAVKFLQETPSSTRSFIRKIILHEDRVSVAWPECHAKGFIPFCLEHPLLYIERQVDLWHTIITQEEVTDWLEFRLISDTQGWPFPDELCYHISDWLEEAGELSRAGMPPQSFRLVVDGSAAPEKASAVFQRLQEDAAVQEAIETSANLSLRQKRRDSDWVSLHFPEIMRGLAGNGAFSFIRCNFNVGDVWDVASIRNTPLGSRREINENAEYRTSRSLYMPDQSNCKTLLRLYYDEDHHWRYLQEDGQEGNYDSDATERCFVQVPYPYVNM